MLSIDAAYLGRGRGSVPSRSDCSDCLRASAACMVRFCASFIAFCRCVSMLSEVLESWGFFVSILKSNDE